ncbi:hypothetical protein OAT16_03380 [Prolixibacteraceae bacterium]|nr:hypothetical protein [Prolixibacteraceae bacterium]
MNIHYQTSIKTAVTFSRWSRKSYALFAVIGRLVRIGFLNMDLSKVDDILLSKQSYRSNSTQDENEEEELMENDMLWLSSFEENLPQFHTVPCDELSYFTFKNTRKG